METMKIIILIKEQCAKLVRDGQVERVFSVSTSSLGTGSEVGSYKTPLGNLKIHQKIGADHPHGRVFRARVPTDDICTENPRSSLWQSAEDMVLSRILWLEGCQPENANTKERFIYLHGTNQEHLLGQPASHGCIRMSNNDIITLFDLVAEGTEVEIID